MTMPIVSCRDGSGCSHVYQSFAAQALLHDDTSGSNAAVAALGAAVSFLRAGLLDTSVLPVARAEALPPAGGPATMSASVAELGPQHMRLDGAALQNLEVGIQDDVADPTLYLFSCALAFDKWPAAHATGRSGAPESGGKDFRQVVALQTESVRLNCCSAAATHCSSGLMPQGRKPQSFRRSHRCSKTTQVGRTARSSRRSTTA